jgi:tRNA pseudouridine38-40 synthase
MELKSKRYALGIEYDGANFHGWQQQDGLRTVQIELQQALSQVADEPIKVICAGRTDKGVHAYGQVVHFDTNVNRPLHAWILGCNSILDNDIAVKWSKEVPNDFHARFTAQRRAYRYIIANTNIPPAIMRNYQTWHMRHLDEQKMLQATQYLLGKHDFSSFRGAGCQAKTPIRTVFEIKICRQNHLIILDITANAFLHHMVRNIIGVLLAIGEGKKPPTWTRDVLETRDRQAGDITAKPNGLYLMRVWYPEKYDILD